MSSVGFDKIVPFGQKFVLDDVPLALTLKEWVALSSCLVDSSVDRCKHSESRSGCGSGSHLACFFDRVEHGSAPCSGNLREKPVLNGVPLGAVGRVMRNSDINPQFLPAWMRHHLNCQFLALLEPPPSQRMSTGWSPGRR